jgi:hypothetical protein
VTVPVEEWQLDTYPMHGADLSAKVGEEGWWACTQPERPYDANVCYDGRCFYCQLHLQVSLQTRAAQEFYDLYVHGQVGFTVDPVTRLEEWRETYGQGLQRGDPRWRPPQT